MQQGNFKFHPTAEHFGFFPLQLGSDDQGWQGWQGKQGGQGRKVGQGIQCEHGEQENFIFQP